MDHLQPGNQVLNHGRREKKGGEGGEGGGGEEGREEREGKERETVYKCPLLYKNCAASYQHLACVRVCCVCECACVCNALLQAHSTASYSHHGTIRALTLSFKLLHHLRHEAVVVGLSPLLEGHSQSLVQPVKLCTTMFTQTHTQMKKKADTVYTNINTKSTVASRRAVPGFSTHSYILHCLRVGWRGVYALPLSYTPCQRTERACVLEEVSSIHPHIPSRSIYCKILYATCTTLDMGEVGCMVDTGHG